MHTQSQALIKQYYDYFNKQDLPAFLGLLDSEVIHDINQSDSQVGVDAFAQFMDKMNHSYQELVKDLVIMTSEDGSRASAEFFIEGIYKATDSTLPAANAQRYSLRCGAFFEIKNNKITRITNYYNMHEWLKQIGE